MLCLFGNSDVLLILKVSYYRALERDAAETAGSVVAVTA
jgi:hypothetical protein